MTLDQIDPDDYFDAADALHWYCVNWHGGQNSVEYSILSKLAFKPGAIANGPDGETAMDVYAALERKEIEPEALLDWIQGQLAAE